MIKGMQHPKQDELIDYVDGEVKPDRASHIEAHLAECRSCEAYVVSVRKAYGALGQDVVPDPGEGFWTYFENRVSQTARRRIVARRGRWVLALAPGVAVAMLLVGLVWRGTWRSGAEADPWDYYLAQMTTGEMVESAAGSETSERVVMDAADNEMSEVDEYLVGTEEIYDLIDTLTDSEREVLMQELNQLMQDEQTSQAITDLSRKEC